MTPPVDIAGHRELFVDDFIIERLVNAGQRLHEPIPAGTAIRIDRPWEGPGNFGLSVLAHQDRYHLYYRGWPMQSNDPNGLGCVAISDDGKTWSKPPLDLFKHPEWKGNNIIVANTGKAELSFPFAPWVDTCPGVPEDERIKGVTSEPLSGARHTAMNDPGGPKRMILWVSADGFRFRRDPERSTFVSPLDNAFDGGNSLFWSEAEQQYVLYYRCCDTVDGVRRRTMARATSPDLAAWSDSVVMNYGDTPREQFYVNNTQPYFRAPHIYLAPAARFMEGRRALTDARAAALDSVHPDFAKDCSDAVLLSTRAGSVRYDRTFMESFVHPGLGIENWGMRSNYPLTGILPWGSDKMMLFVSRHYTLPSWHIERFLLRTDGFASIRAPWAGGEMITRALIFSGDALEINYRTGASGYVRVEIQDFSGKPIPGYALADAPGMIGDEIARTVAWRDGVDVSALAGRPVRLRFVMKDADCYSFRFFSGRTLL